MFGVQAGPFETIGMATRHGFEGIDVNFVSSSEEIAAHGGSKALRDALDAAGLWTGAAGLLPGTMSATEQDWTAGLKSLSGLARMACDAGFTRSTIVVLPFHEKLNFDKNFALHIDRLRQVAPVLADYGIRLGLEYVSPETRRAPFPHAFVHDLKGMLQLIDEAGQNNIGLLLDSFHWYCAGENRQDIAALRNRPVVVVHINDAPAGRSLRQQSAFERELPGSTGVIDLDGFLGVLNDIDYEGPVTCEPMNNALNGEPPEKAIAAVKHSMDRVWA
jgi:sugar phosphate isomerase/epimerase